VGVNTAKWHAVARMAARDALAPAAAGAHAP